MQAPVRSAGLLAMGLIAALGSHPASAQQPMSGVGGELIQSLLPSVVSIFAVMAATPPTDAGATTNAAAVSPQTSRGSGFVIDQGGLIATNDHVIHGAYQIQVTFSDGESVAAKLVATSPMIDIAVIKVETRHPLVPVRWGDSNKLQIGDPVIAIGNALGLGMAVSSGVVSALNKNINASPFDDYIQTDAAINHGNSGGPLFNAAGEVIGMDTALVSPTTGSVGLGFAQPATDVKFVTDRLIRYGWTRPGWAGGTVEDVTPELAQALGMPEPKGMIITSLVEGGPAATAGLQVGDVVLRLGDRTPRDSRQLKRLVAQANVGDIIPVTVLRDGQERTFQMTIKLWPLSAEEVKAESTQPVAPTFTVPADLGLSLSAITSDVRAKYGLDVAQSGVVINGIAAGTDAATRGVSSGDIILRVQGALVQTPQQVQVAIDAVRAQRRPLIAVLVLQRSQGNASPTWIPFRVSSP